MTGIYVYQLNCEYFGKNTNIPKNFKLALHCNFKLVFNHFNILGIVGNEQIFLDEEFIYTTS